MGLLMSVHLCFAYDFRATSSSAEPLSDKDGPPAVCMLSCNKLE